MPKRVDANQAEIVKALRQAGASVQSLHTIGKGCPDLLVGYQGANYVFEVKTRKGEVTPEQYKWFVCWGGLYDVVFSPEDALKAIGATR